jgi:YbbR domain-containing protein
MFVLSRTQTELSVKLEPAFHDVPQGLALLQYEPREVSVLLRGNERLLRQLSPGDIRLSISLKGLKEGRNFMPLKDAYVQRPGFLRVEGLSPSGIWVELRPVGRRLLPVRADIRGSPQEGFMIERIEVSPGEVMVEAFQEELAGFNSVLTETLDISRASQSVVETLRVVKPPRALRIQPQEVVVKVVIRKR